MDYYVKSGRERAERTFDLLVFSDPTFGHLTVNFMRSMFSISAVFYLSYDWFIG